MKYPFPDAPTQVMSLTSSSQGMEQSLATGFVKRGVVVPDLFSVLEFGAVTSLQIVI